MDNRALMRQNRRAALQHLRLTALVPITGKTESEEETV